MKNKEDYLKNTKKRTKSNHKLKHGAKHILNQKIVLAVSLCVIAIAVAVVLLVVFLPKNKDESEIPQFSEEQIVMFEELNQIKQIAVNDESKQLAQTANLEVDGKTLEYDDIYAFFDGYFVVIDSDGNKNVIVENSNLNFDIFKILKEQNKLSEELKPNAEKVFNKLLLFSYEQSNDDKFFKIYELIDFSDLNDIKVLNKIQFEKLGNEFIDGEKILKNFDFNICDGFIEIVFKQEQNLQGAISYSESLNGWVKKVYAFGNDEPKQTLSYDSFEELESAKMADGVSVVKNGNIVRIFYVTKDGNETKFETFSYDEAEGFVYNFYAICGGVVIEKRQEIPISEVASQQKSVFVGEKVYKFDYEFFNFKTKTTTIFATTENMVKATFVSLEKYTVVFEQFRENSLLSENGKISYFDENFNLVVSYDATSFDSIILYANQSRFVTKDGIFEILNRSKQAIQKFDFNSEETNFEILTDNINCDYFVVRDRDCHLSLILDIFGSVYGNEGYVSILEFGKGNFISTKNGQRHFICPQKDEKILLENYADSKGLYFPMFGMFLKDEGDEFYSIFDGNNNEIEDKVKIEAFARENFVMIVVSKQNYQKVYTLTNKNELGDEKVNYIVD